MYLERTEQTLIHTHHSSSVIKLAAVIRRTEKCHQLSFREKLVPVFDHLMCSADKVHVMFLQKSRYDIWTECEGDAAIVFTPPSDVFIWV